MFGESKTIKRIISVSAAAVCMLSSLRIAPADYFTAQAAETMTAFEITENMKVGWNLGNTMDAKAGDENGDFKTAGLETETAWGCPKANQKLFDALKAKGFNTVRIPTTWFQHLDENDNIDPAWLARVHEVVDYAYKNGMYVILNVHHENWINRPDLLTAYDEINKRLMKIWTQVATEFKDYDQHLIFECMNEPRAVGTTYEWWSATPVKEADVINKLNADFVKLIRGMDGPYAKTRLLMLPGYVASSDKTFLSQIVMPDDDFCAVSIHAYTPYNFTMNTDESTGAYHDTFTKEFSNDLAYNLQNFRDMFVQKGIPVVIGEMGTSNFGNTEARVEWTTQYFTTTKKYGIPCCLWDNNTESNPKDPGECHGYINRETGEWYQASLPVINKMMEIMNDKSIVWGSEGKMPEYDHADLSTGKVVLENSTIDVALTETYGNSTPGKEISWDDLKGKEVAIKFTGDVPVLAVSDKDYKGWSEMSAYTVDEKNGIAYYLVDQQVPAAYSGDLSTINHLQARTPGKTTIEKMVIINAPDVKLDVKVDKTKKYDIDFANAKAGDNLILTFKGDANTDTNGAVGYNGTGWQEVKWEGKSDANGDLTVKIPMSEFADGVKSGECQIWYNPEVFELTGYNFGSGETTTTTESTTTTTTTTTTSTSTTTTTSTSATTSSSTVSSTTSTASTTESTTTSTSTTEKKDDKVVYGDANCDGIVNLSDAVLIMQNIANPGKFGPNGSDANHLTEQGQKNADCCNPGDGVTNKDALAIQKLLLELVQTLPVSE